MELVYKKLYDKYTALKINKLSELEQRKEEQEDKFLTYLAAAEELIDHLRSENDKLNGLIDDLRTELASVRNSKDNQIAEFQRLLMEERIKQVALVEEVEKLQNLLKEGTPGDLNNSSKVTTIDGQVNDTPNNNSSIRMTRKRMRQEQDKLENEARLTRKRMRQEQDSLEKEARFISCENDEGNSVEGESTQNFHKEAASNKMLECSTKADDQSGVDLQENVRDNWLVQALFEYTLDMKLSTDNQTGRLCLSAMHQSSGYSFSLTWISKTPEEEAELLYHVLSLGTLERFAPAWMREDIMFSPTMCPIFFERILRVIKLKH